MQEKVSPFLVARDAQDAEVGLVVVAAPGAVLAEGWFDVVDVDVAVGEELVAFGARVVRITLLDRSFGLCPAVVGGVLAAAFA